MPSMRHAMLKQTVRSILERASAYTWSLQGFGMLRLHMRNGMRLNIWDSRFRVPEVSLIHTHPWHFTSTVVAGKLFNHRYTATSGNTHLVQTITPGVGCSLSGEPKLVALVKQPFEEICEGQVYNQQADEIHLSNPYDGTVTMTHRVKVGPDEAQVYWDADKQFVSAEPRRAEPDEVTNITSLAITNWFVE